MESPIRRWSRTYSNLNMKASLDQTGHEPGADMLAEVVITEYGGPLRGSATVSADVTKPNGTLQKITLAHEGDGVFTGQMTANAAGLYSWRFRADGKTRRERPFTREQIRTASVWSGGDQPGEPSQPGGGTGNGDGRQGRSDRPALLPAAPQRSLRRVLRLAPVHRDRF